MMIKIFSPSNMYVCMLHILSFFFFSSRRRHTRLQGDWSSDVCSSDLWNAPQHGKAASRMEGFAGGASLMTKKRQFHVVQRLKTHRLAEAERRQLLADRKSVV